MVAAQSGLLPVHAVIFGPIIFPVLIAASPPMPMAIELPTNPPTVFFVVCAQNAQGMSPPSKVLSITDPPDEMIMSWVPAPISTNAGPATNFILSWSETTNTFTTSWLATSPTNRQSYGTATNGVWPFFWSNYVTVIEMPGTGNVYAADSILGPWTQIRTNCHGVVGAWTNSNPDHHWYSGGKSRITISKTGFN